MDTIFEFVDKVKKLIVGLTYYRMWLESIHFKLSNKKVQRKRNKGDIDPYIDILILRRFVLISWKLKNEK